MAEFQSDLTLAANASDSGLKSPRPPIPPIPPMPYGYPTRLYHPLHSVVLPRATKSKKHSHGKLSNDVPWVLGMEVVHNYAVGLYNPRKAA